MRKKVVFITNYILKYRESFFNELQKYLDVNVICLQNSNVDNRINDSLDSGEIFTKQVLGNSVFDKISLNINSLSRINFDDYDYVIISDNVPNFIDMLYISNKVRNNKLYLWSEVSFYSNYPYAFSTKLIHKFLFKELVRRVDNIISFNDLCFKLLEQNFEDKNIIRAFQSHDYSYEIIRKPIISGDKVKVGFIGYFSERKGLSKFFSLFDNVDVDFYIAGTGDRKIVEQVENEVANRSNVHYLGFVTADSKSHFYNLIDFLVVPSLFEPWGLVVNEAVKFGVIPVVASGVLSKEILTEELVFQDDLVEKFNLLVSKSPTEIEQLKSKLQSNILKYTIDNSARSFYEVLL